MHAACNLLPPPYNQYCSMAAPYAIPIAKKMYDYYSEPTPIGKSFPKGPSKKVTFSVRKAPSMVNYYPASKGGPYNQGGKVRRKPRRKIRRKIRRRPRRPGVSRRTVSKMLLNKDINESTNTYRSLLSGQLTVEANQCSYNHFTFLDYTGIRDAISQSVARDVDTANNRIEDIAIDRTDATDVANTSNVDTWIINATRIVTLRNNGGTPIIFEAYWFHQRKAMTNVSTILTKLQEGFVTKGATSGTCMTDPRYSVRDAGTYFSKFFKMFKYRQFLLNAGDQIVLRLSRKRPFLYNETGQNEQHTRPYTQHMLFRLIGVVSHDETTTSNVGTCNGTIDWTSIYHIKFNSENDQGFKYFIESGTWDEQTTPLVDVDEHEETKEDL